jgi:hypothetical protein
MAETLNEQDPQQAILQRVFLAPQVVERIGLRVGGLRIVFVDGLSHSNQCTSRRTRDTACVVVSTSVIALE